MVVRIGPTQGNRRGVRTRFDGGDCGLETVRCGQNATFFEKNVKIFGKSFGNIKIVLIFVSG